jgi:hypothetical protein
LRIINPQNLCILGFPPSFTLALTIKGVHNASEAKHVGCSPSPETDGMASSRLQSLWCAQSIDVAQQRIGPLSLAEVPHQMTDHLRHVSKLSKPSSPQVLLMA